MHVDTAEKLRLEVCGAFCRMSVFRINGIDAVTEDFGCGADEDPYHAFLEGCGNRVFRRIPATDEVMNKYGISLEDYDEVAGRLEELLSFGSCSWCV